MPTDPNFIMWLIGGACALLYSVFGYLYIDVQRTKTSVETKSEELRRELLTLLERSEKVIDERHKENRETLTDVRAEIFNNRDASIAGHNKLSSELSSLNTIVAKLPNREDVRADMQQILQMAQRRN